MDLLTVAEVFLAADYFDMPSLIEEVYSSICTRLVRLVSRSRWDYQWFHNSHRGRKELHTMADLFWTHGSPLGIRLSRRINGVLRRTMGLAGADAVLAEVLRSFPDQRTLIVREWNW